MALDAVTEPGISLLYLLFCAWLILTPLYLALGMLCCKHTLLENISALPRSHAPSQGVAGYQTSSMFVPVDPLLPSGIASHHTLRCGLAAPHK